MTTINTIEDLMRLLDESPEWLEAVRARILTRELLDLPGQFARFAETTDQRFDTMNGRFDRVQDDMGELKDWGTSNVVLKNSAAIANAVGLRRTRNLSQDELFDLTRGQDTTDIARNELDSFHAADLIMEATDDNRQLHYIAVEASYTADERDTRRVIRNAGYMTRFTGQSAHAVIAAMRTDHRIDALVSSGAVHWHKLPERSLHSA